MLYNGGNNLKLIFIDTASKNFFAKGTMVYGQFGILFITILSKSFAVLKISAKTGTHSQTYTIYSNSPPPYIMPR